MLSVKATLFFECLTLPWFSTLLLKGGWLLVEEEVRGNEGRGERKRGV